MESNKLSLQREHASTITLSDESDGRLTVNISDAVSELETVKFTIQTKVSLLTICLYSNTFWHGLFC